MDDQQRKDRENPPQMGTAIETIIRTTSREEKRTLLDWLSELIGIRNSDLPKREKIKRILLSLRHSTKLLRLLKPLWESRSKRFKVGIGVLLGTAVFFPGNIGIAVAGAGVGIPLWVLSASGYFALTGLVEELKRHLDDGTPRGVIDAEYTVVETKDADQR